MKIYSAMASLAAVVACSTAGCWGAPPRRHVLWDRPHSSLPSWFPPKGPTWIQKVYYTLTSHFGSAIAAGFGSFFGPVGPFVSSYSQPYLSTYVSRLTGDVVARSLNDASAPQLDSSLPIPEVPRNLDKAGGPGSRAPSYNDVFQDDLTEGADDFDALAKERVSPTLLKDKIYDDYFGEDLEARRNKWKVVKEEVGFEDAPSNEVTNK